MENKLRLQIIVPHPDDELAVAGTAANYARAGHAVEIVWLTRGDLGHMTMPRDELARVRTLEGEAAAKTLGAACKFLDYRDSEVPHSRETTMVVVDLIRAFRPNIVVTWGPIDHHPDHRNTHLNVVDAMHLTALPLLETACPAHDPDALFFIAEDEAEVFVDITETFEAKMEAARHYKSQYGEWLVDHRAGTDKAYPSDTEELYRVILRDPARAAGIRSGVRFAEGYTCFVRPKPAAAKLLPLG